VPSFITCGISVSYHGYQIYGIHVLPKLGSAIIVSTSFDLWMSKGGINMFSLVINYFSKAWELVHATIGLFEINETTGSCMAQ
jgi:hypothetical protein